jgi:hypothetical protein
MTIHESSPSSLWSPTEFHSLAEQLKDDVDRLRREKQTAFESQSEEWRNSEQGTVLEDEIVLLEDFHDALETVLNQMRNLFTFDHNGNGARG